VASLPGGTRSLVDSWSWTALLAGLVAALLEIMESSRLGWNWTDGTS
jgi:hypothetical protein